MQFPTFQHSVRITYDGLPIDYLVEVDASGYVHSTRATLLDLPPVVQKMTFGDKGEGFKEGLIARGSILQYELLLVLCGERGQWTADLQPLAEKINRRLKMQGANWKTLPPEGQSARMQWLRQAAGLQGRQLKKIVEDKFLGHLGVLVDRIRGKNTVIYDSARFMGYYGGTGGQEVMMNFIPLLAGNERRLSLEVMKYETRPEAMRFLLDQLTVADNKDYVSGALAALKKYNFPELFEAVAGFYHRELGNHREDTLANVASIMGKFSGRQAAQDIVLAIVRLKRRHSANAATRALKNMKYPQEVLMEEMLPVLFTDNRPDIDGVFAMMGQFDAYALPDGETLWRAYVHSQLTYANANISYTMPSLLSKRVVPNLEEKVVAALQHDSSYVRRSTVTVVSCSFNHLGGERSYFRVTPDITDALIKLVGGDDQETSRLAIEVLARLDRLQLPATIVTDLVEIYQRENHAVLQQLAILSTLYGFFEKIPYNPVVEPICLAALDHPQNDNYRTRAIGILSNSRNPAVRQRLNELRNDPNRGVRQALERAQLRKQKQSDDLFKLGDQTFEESIATALRDLEKKRQRDKIPEVGSSDGGGLIGRLRKWLKG